MSKKRRIPFRTCHKQIMPFSWKLRKIQEQSWRANKHTPMSVFPTKKRVSETFRVFLIYTSRENGCNLDGKEKCIYHSIVSGHFFTSLLSCFCFCFVLFFVLFCFLFSFVFCFVLFLHWIYETTEVSNNK